MLRKLLLSLCFISFYFYMQAQNHQDVFPGISGQPLLDSLVVNYKPAMVLSWTEAKDTLFKVIDLYNDTVTCVYTAHQKWLDPTQDPDTWMAANGSQNGLNVEHTYPQSKGAANGNARSDMHHLYPTLTECNNARGNLPFSEINDTFTSNWFYLTYNAQGIPAFNRDLYSELITNQKFEPREDWKGNVARAMFYFYTMYYNEAMAADTGYFNLQRNTLCDWHYQDPVDAAEWDRTYRVAAYQDSKPNPYVLDCSLAQRSFCNDPTITCIPTAIDRFLGSEIMQIHAIFPNPLQSSFIVNYSIEQKAVIRMEIFNLMGQKVSTLLDELQNVGNYQIEASLPEDFPNGMYFLRLYNSNNNQFISRKIQIQR